MLMVFRYLINENILKFKFNRDFLGILIRSGILFFSVLRFVFFLEGLWFCVLNFIIIKVFIGELFVLFF